MSILNKNLKKYFNFNKFLPGQKEVVEAIVDGRDVVALMPTGGGKSLCYQLPAVLADGLTIIISPLIALMKDQVDSLRARGIEATFINSSLGFDEIEYRTRQIQKGEVKILYIAPERLSNRKFLALVKSVKVDMIAIDEAHCISQWGHDFRPEYRQIRLFIDSFNKRPVVSAFTATATPEVKQDIIERLNIPQAGVFVRGFDRPNLRFFTQSGLKKKECWPEALRMIKSMPGSGIVYTITRKETEGLAEYCQKNKISAQAYHGGMTTWDRTKIQNDFMENRFKVIVATVAFGMGVDKADIRFVIHVGMPATLEGYYQEAGRAGRDGEMAYCILLHGSADMGKHYFMIKKSKRDLVRSGRSWDEANMISDIKYNLLMKINDYAISGSCRRRFILDYFADEDIKNLKENCGGCDVCLNYQWKKIAGNKLSKNSKGLIHQAPKENDLSPTVLQTVELYKQGMSPDKIAKARSLGTNTIWNHLIKWYQTGGDLEINDLVSATEQNLIFNAIIKSKGVKKLKPLKEMLPKEISYEKIKLVLAKVPQID